MSATITAAPPRFTTVADLLHRLGDIPPERVRMLPLPGTATAADVLAMEANGVLCELIEGVLVEKAMGLTESILAVFIIEHLNQVVRPANLGIVTGEAGAIALLEGLIRIPDVAFASWDRLPGRRIPTDPIPNVVPDLAIEVLSRSNTRAEMARKREDYFNAGVLLVWEVDPETRTVTVYTAADQSTVLGETDTLDGGTVLPGFMLSLSELFGELDRHG